MVFGLVGLSIGDHALDFVFGKSRTCLNRNRVFPTRCLIFGRNVQDTVGIDIKRHFNLRQTTRRRRNSFQVKFTEKLVGCGHLVLALVDLNGHGRLVILGCRENLRMLGRNRRVAFNHRCHDAAQGFDTERKRCDIKKQHVVAFTGQNRALNGRTDSNGFIGVHVLSRLFPEELANHFLHTRHT